MKRICSDNPVSLTEQILNRLGSGDYSDDESEEGNEFLVSTGDMNTPVYFPLDVYEGLPDTVKEHPDWTRNMHPGHRKVFTAGMVLEIINRKKCLYGPACTRLLCMSPGCTLHVEYDNEYCPGHFDAMCRVSACREERGEACTVTMDDGTEVGVCYGHYDRQIGICLFDGESVTQYRGESLGGELLGD